MMNKEKKNLDRTIITTQLNFPYLHPPDTEYQLIEPSLISQTLLFNSEVNPTLLYSSLHELMKLHPETV